MHPPSSGRNRIFLLVSLFLGLGANCKPDKSEPLTGIYSAAKPWRQKLEITKPYVAQIRAIQHIEIRAFEKGYLQDIFVDEGQFTKKGNKMFQIMPFLMNAEYQKAKAELEISKIECANTESLAIQKVVSANELALAKAKVDKYAAELNLAKTHLDLTTIRAPFDGIIDRFRVRLGSLIEEGALLTNLSDISQLWVYFNLSESDYLSYMKKKSEGIAMPTVHLALANGQLYDSPGHFDTIEADFDNDTGNVPCRATFPNPNQLLRHGETGNVLLPDTLDNALVIPQKATFEIIDKRYVYIVNADNVVESREVVIDKEVPHLFAIKSGLTEEDTVLLEGLGKLTKGSIVRTRLLATAEVQKGLVLRAQ